MTENIIYPPNSTTLNDFRRSESLLSVADLKKRYLFAVDFRDKDGNELPDEALAFYIDSAISQIEHECDLLITPTQLREDRDYILNDYVQWCYMELDYAPVISVDKFYLRFQKDENFVEFPQEWIRLDNHTGVIRIAATQGTIMNWVITKFSFLPRLLTSVRDFPFFFNIEYTAGFEQDKIPKMINHAVGLTAAIDALNIAGDIILGAGIASQSLSIDGMSQSISTTSSATNAGYGARILTYQKQLKELKATIMKFYGKDVKIAVV